MNKDTALDLALEVMQINLKLLEKINPYKGQEDLLSDSLDLTHKAITAIKQARSAPVQDLPFGVGGGLVAIKTLLSRDPFVHANTAIEMIDAILKEHPAAQRQWVGLTDEEKLHIEIMGGKSDVMLAEMVEAKLRSKNNG